MDRDEMLRVLTAFEREGLEYVLIGVPAMGLPGLVRATEDLRYYPPSGDLCFDVMTRLGKAARYESVAALCALLAACPTRLPTGGVPLPFPRGRPGGA